MPIKLNFLDCKTMRKYLLSPLFMPVVILLFWFFIMDVTFAFFSQNLMVITQNNGPIEHITYILYTLMLAFFILCYKDFFRIRTDYFIFVFFGICAFLREMGIQHHLASRDTTPFKSRFFINPANPLEEKIIFGLILLLIFGLLIYLAVKYARFLIDSFLKFRMIGWSAAVLCTMLVFTKILDRFPSNFKRYTGEYLNPDIRSSLMLIEESGEMLLPLIVMIFLLQYHALQKQRWG